MTAIISNEEHLMEPWGFVAAAVALFFIGFFGFFFNLFVIVLMFNDIQLWTPMNIILFNLVCSDFSVSIFGNPFTLLSTISHRWIFGNKMCTAYGFFMSILGITSITTLTVLSYERYCLISYPFSSKHLTRRGAIITVFFIWVYSFILTVPPIFGWGAYVNEAANISCSVNWESQTVNATTYIIFLFVMGLIVPVIIISYSYLNILSTMRKNSVRLNHINRAEKRITWMVAVMIIAFILAWTPYAVFALIKQFGPTDYIGPGMAVLPALIAKSSICYNPIIYVGMNTQYRAAWNRRRGRDRPNQAITIMNQQTMSSSRLSIDCTFDVLKTKKNKIMKNQKKIEENPLNNNRVVSGNETNCSQNSAKNDYELSVITCGKSILIKANSYTSNIY